MNRQPQTMIDSLLDRQKQAWLEGKRPSVEECLKGASIPQDPDLFLDFLYHEIVLREELGEYPTAAEYIRRYPHLQEDLHLHFDVHLALRENLQATRRHGHTEESVPDREVSLQEDGPYVKDYQCIAALGQGGMGIVYKARHRLLNRFVALKMFKPGRFPSQRELLRFKTEAEAIARLQHPNIVQIFEIGQTQGLPYLALELAEKGTLAHKLQHFPFTPRAAAELIETLSRAIHHAHEQHIVHRDLKPANVLFTQDDTPKITDFGLAKFLEGDVDSPHDATRTGEPIGTPRYMAPEQAAGRPDQVGPATDVYALGTLLYECLTGQAPFVATSAVETMEKIRHEIPLSPRRLQPSIPRDLETICLNCLHKQPGRRYTSALALGEDVRRYLQGKPIQARPTPAWERGWMWSRRHPTRATLMVVGLLLVLTGLIGYEVRQHVERQRIVELRQEVGELVQEAQEAVERQDYRTAEARFRLALTRIRTEPALYDEELGVAGWWDHSRREVEQQRWKQRIPPPLFEELRDEAFLQSVLLPPHLPEAVQAAREAIRTALALTVPDDLAWDQEREQLILLDAALIFRKEDAAKALLRLDEKRRPASRLWHLRRADYLERTGRNPEANQVRIRARELPPKQSMELLFRGIDRIARHQLQDAINDFDEVLALEPDHFIARIFQGACFLQLRRASESKVTMTACLGQRPRCVWGYLIRGQACVHLGESASAARDFRQVLEMNPDKAARLTALTQLGLLQRQMGHADQIRATLRK